MSKIKHMSNEILEHLDKILTIYTQGEYFEILKAAKEDYFSLTGKFDEDKDDFEARMNSFNDWYIFQFVPPNGVRIIEEYLRAHQISDELSRSLLNLNHSLFEFSKISWRGQIVLEDILHQEKITLVKNHPHIGLMQGDLFTGRLVKYQQECYLLKGVCILPGTIKSNLKKESKRVKKQNSFEQELHFLLQLEAYKTKSTHYSHIDPSRIFIFN